MPEKLEDQGKNWSEVLTGTDLEVAVVDADGHFVVCSWAVFWPAVLHDLAEFALTRGPTLNANVILATSIFRGEGRMLACLSSMRRRVDDVLVVADDDTRMANCVATRVPPLVK